MASNNPPSQRYPFENDLAQLPHGVQRAVRNVWFAITDLQNANITRGTQIEALGKSTGTSTAVATVPVTDAPLIANPNLGVFPVPISGRQGVSPTGNTSPNSSSTANTGASYQQGAFITGVNQQLNATAYTLQNTDYGGVTVFNTTSNVTVQLNSGVVANFAANLMNVGKGTITVTTLFVTLGAGGTGYSVNDVLTIVQGGASGGTVLVTSVSGGVITGIQLITGGTGYQIANGLATTGGTGTLATINVTVAPTTVNLGAPPTPTPFGYINNVSSVTFQSGAFAIVAFDGQNWWAMAFNGVLPQSFTPVPGEFLTGYNSATGQFSAAIVSSQYPYRAVTSAYPIVTTDYQIECTSGTFTVTLPTAVGIPGQSFAVKDSGTGIITVATTSSQTIDGSLTQTLTQYDNIVVMSNGANWIIV